MCSSFSFYCVRDDIWMGGKRGRPKKEETKSKEYKMRIGLEEEEMLEFLMYKEGAPKSEVIRKALKMYYNFKKYTD